MENRQVVATLEDGVQKIRVTPGPCANPRGHEFSPEAGAPFGEFGNCCAHCGAFDGVKSTEATR